MSHERITLDMNLFQAFAALAEGNPGALVACLDITKVAKTVDPDDVMGGFGTILMLDTLGIYGSRLYMLHNDVCHRDTGKMIAVLRAYQLGQLAGVTASALNHAIDNRGQGIDVDAAVAAVKKELPGFMPETTVETTTEGATVTAS